MSILMMREVYLRGAPIPFVNLRAAADYTHSPVRRYHVRCVVRCPMCAPRSYEASEEGCEGLRRVMRVGLLAHVSHMYM